MADPILIPDTTTELRPMSRRCERTLGGRDPLDQWAGRRDDVTLAAYQAQRNTTSIDDLPACPWPPVTSRRVRAEGGRPHGHRRRKPLWKCVETS
jgi:hypothetical protein